MKATKLLIQRYSHGEKQTIGNLFGLSDNGHILFECDSLELPWLNNQKQISCKPTGKYLVKKRYSKKFKNHLHITNVEDRSYILIHSGNYYTDILGCVLVGRLGFVNSDDIIDVSSSKKTLKKLLTFVESDIELEIINR